jgi:hypothetical protein
VKKPQDDMDDFDSQDDMNDFDSLAKKSRAKKSKMT